jgi:hypothetical protein
MKSQIDKHQRETSFLILILIILGSLLVRLYKIQNPIADWHSWRQADTASVARIYVSEGINLLNPRYYDISSIQTGYFNSQGLRLVEFPIYNATHAILYEIFPKIGFEVWGRLISIFCSLITTALLYLIGKRFINRDVGLWTAFFFGFIPFNIYYSRVILPEPMATTFAIASIFLFTLHCDKNKKIYLYLSAILFALAILVTPYVGFYAIPIAYLGLEKYGLKIFVNIPLLMALDIALIPLFAWRAFIFEKVEGIPPVAWAFNGDGIRFRPAFWWWIFGQRIGNLILGVWGICLFVLGLIKNNKKNELVIEFMALGAFAFVSIVATANVRHDYYQTLIIPPIALILAIGADTIFKTEGLRSKIILFLIIPLMFLLGLYQVKEYYKINHPEFVTAGAEIDKIASHDAKIIAPNNGDTAFLYQTKRFGWPVLDRSIEEAIQLGAKYYVSVTLNDTDTLDFKKRFKTVEENNQFIILDLSQQIDKKK